MRAAALALAAVLWGCGGDAEPAPDAALVDALVEVHLADARAALDTSAADIGALGDSLKRAALAAHGLDSATVADRLDRLARDPALARATYAAVDETLSRERRGLPSRDTTRDD